MLLRILFASRLAYLLLLPTLSFGETALSYYGILGIEPTAQNSEIKAAYRKKALQWHPDKHLEDKKAAEHHFRRIVEAYETLSNRQTREQYDRSWAAGVDFVLSASMQPNCRLNQNMKTFGIQTLFEAMFDESQQPVDPKTILGENSFIISLEQDVRRGVLFEWHDMRSTIDGAFYKRTIKSDKENVFLAHSEKYDGLDHSARMSWVSDPSDGYYDKFYISWDSGGCIRVTLQPELDCLKHLDQQALGIQTLFEAMFDDNQKPIDPKTVSNTNSLIASLEEQVRGGILFEWHDIRPASDGTTYRRTIKSDRDHIFIARSEKKHRSEVDDLVSWVSDPSDGYYDPFYISWGPGGCISLIPTSHKAQTQREEGQPSDWAAAEPLNVQSHEFSGRSTSHTEF